MAPMKILRLWLQYLLLNAQTFQSLQTHLIAPGRLISVSYKSWKFMAFSFRQDDPLVSPRATINFTADGKLILENGRGETKAIANIQTAASTASMLDSGNSVLLDNKSTVIWDSFDHPTDTIWGGRGLIVNRKLASGASPLDHLSGSFSAYWASESDTFVYQASKGRSDTFPYLDPETELLSLHHSNATFRFLTLTTYQARFGPDGSFVLYSHSFCVDGNMTVVEEWSALEGLKAYSKFNVALEDCHQKCLDDCNCWVALFDNGTCDKYKLAVMSAIPNLKNSVTALVKSVSPGNPIVSSEPKIVVERKKALCFDCWNAYGAAYKGNLSESNKSIAMKTLKNVEEGGSKFQAEITPVGQTHERNLGSFSNYLFRADNEPPWKERVRIALDVAREFLCLHKECKLCIIHSKLLMTNQSGTFTGAKGSSGYMAPEWEKGALLTEKADVYSSGAVLLGIICWNQMLCVQDDANQWPPMKDVILMLEERVNIREPGPLVAC
ncbi:Non-specific serine/threonine protein kinase [Handroanthus impetiginosus]|uniref:Non-specific serine/threonine protein kinase n=1 Tax=Handroanthus impetiginosus TaxID=429701 RepID=A0A2G9HQR4_9LAMI|nr:Non-specific serine/threonine protein kinase [Handroanthus impetiginosus]